MPGLLQLAVTVRQFGFEDLPPTSPPPRVLEAAAVALAPIGRLVGRRPHYPRFAEAGLAA